MNYEKLFADFKANYPNFVQEIPREQLEEEHRRFRQEMLNRQKIATNQPITLSSQEKDNMIEKLTEEKNEKIELIQKLKEHNVNKTEWFEKELRQKADEIETLKLEEDMKSVTIENLEKELREKKVALEDKDNEIKTLSDENNKQMAKVKDLEEKLQEMTEMRNKYQQHIEKHAEWCQNAEEVERMKEVLELKNEEIEKITKENNEKLETVRNLEKKLQESGDALLLLTNGKLSLGEDLVDCKESQHCPTCPLLLQKFKTLQNVYDLFLEDKKKLEQRFENHLRWCQEAENKEIEDNYGIQSQNAELQKKVESLELENQKIQESFKEKELKWAKSWERLCYLEYAFDIHDEKCPYAKEVQRLNEELKKQVVKAEAEKKMSGKKRRI